MLLANPTSVIGLSKERPILDHHAKAHIHEIRRISYGFHEIWWISGEIRQILGGFHTDFMKSGGFQVKSGRFHTDFTHRISCVKSGGKTNCQEW